MPVTKHKAAQGPEAAVQAALQAAATDPLLRRVAEDAYQRGHQDGFEAAREAMAASLQGLAWTPVQATPRGDATDNAAEQRKPSKQARLPKGAIGAHLRRLLPELQPATIQQLSGALNEHGVRASPEAIGAELRRNVGTRYSRNKSGQWVLLRNPEKEPAEVSNPAPTAVPST